MSKRLVWTLLLMLAGVLLGFKTASSSEHLLFPIFAFGGAALGLGFGSAFSNTGKKRAIIYLAITFGMIGFVFGVDGATVRASRLARRTAFGIAIGVVLGTVNHLAAWKKRGPIVDDLPES